MSHDSTPLESVAWASRSSTARMIASRALWRLLWLWRLGKVSVGGIFCAITGPVTIALGWTHHFPPHKNQQICSTLSEFCLTRSRVGASYNDEAYKLSALLIFSLTLFPGTPQIATAEAAVSTAPTRLIIPSIALDSAIVPVGWKKVEVNGQIYPQWEVDENLIGWHNLSAPLGQVGNSVLNGHSNLYAQVFRNLHKVKVGDRIIAFANDQSHYYIVSAKFLVQEKGVTIEKRLENGKLILPTADERLTLITCALAGATHRLIIVAYPEASYSR